MVASRGIYGPRGQGCLRDDGYILVANKLQHIFVAEKALGRPLPRGSRVHHVDENRSNNENSNLVICPDNAYHMLIHRRMKALAATGNAASRKCKICLSWDSPENLKTYGKETVHKECNRLKQLARRSGVVK